MARARNIKPSFFMNEDLAELPFHTRLLFIGLWTLADREGRLEDRPKKIKMGVFPADNIEVDAALAELDRAKFILRYSVRGVGYIQILAFEKHQNPHHREPPSTIQKPEASPGLAADANAALPGASPGPAGRIPDSGFIDTGRKALSGADAPDAVGKSETPVQAARRMATAAAKEAIDYLNAKAGTKFRHTPANLKFAIDRQLVDKATPEDLKAVVDAKIAESAAGKFDRKYLRPETLWNATKFGSYIGQVGASSLSVVKTIHVAVDLKVQAGFGGRRASIAEYTWTNVDFDAFELVVRTARNPAHRQQMLGQEVEAVLVYVDKEPGIKGRWSPAEVKEGMRKAA